MCALAMFGWLQRRCHETAAGTCTEASACILGTRRDANGPLRREPLQRVEVPLTDAITFG